MKRLKETIFTSFNLDILRFYFVSSSWQKVTNFDTVKITEFFSPVMLRRKEEQTVQNLYAHLEVFNDAIHWLCFIFRSSHQTCSIIKGVLRNFAKFTGKHLCKSLFFNKVAGLHETLAQVFSCEFYKISKNTFFTEHLRTTASLFWQYIMISFLQVDLLFLTNS